MTECEFETVYLFRKSGIGISSNHRDDYVNTAFFHHDSGMTSSRQVTRYKGNLLAGIVFGDSRERKLQSKAARVLDFEDEHQEHYIQGPIEYWFSFSPNKGLVSLSIWHQDWLREYSANWK